MDETVIGGANLFWPAALGIGPNDPGDQVQFSYLIGLTVSAPYLCCVRSCFIRGPYVEALSNGCER
jgi:hypothetical protein